MLVGFVAMPALAVEPCVPTDSPIGDISMAIRLSELLPIPPDGKEEFIELVNTGSSTVNLTGWQLRDASGKTFVLSSENIGAVSLSGGDFLVIPQSISKIYLNNGSDSVELVRPDNVVADKTVYEDAANGFAWARSGSDWAWTSNITPGEANSITGSVEDDSSSGSGGGTDPQTSKKIVLSELLPNPVGLDSTDEWIEIVNTGNAAVNLSGWQLTDTSKYFTIGDLKVAGGEYLVFDVQETGISLNNSGETVYLIDPFGEIINGTTYEGGEEGLSWALDGSDWHWTSTLTPGEANVIAAPEGEAAEASDPSSENADVLPIDAFRSLEDGQVALIEGVVSVLPGVFGSQYFYIQDDSAGVQVYSYSKAFPAGLAVGDRVRVRGEKSTARGEVRLKTSALEDIVIVNSGEVLTPRDAVELDESLEGMLVQTDGVVTDKSGSDVYLNDALHVVLKDAAGIDTSVFTEGSGAAVLGIVAQYDDDYRLMPRSNDDITGVEVDNAGVPSASAASGFGNPDSLDGDTAGLPTLPSTTTLLVVVVAGLLATLGGIWLRHKKQRSKNDESTALFQFMRKKQPTDLDKSQNDS